MNLRDIFVCVSLLTLGLTAELTYLWMQYNATINEQRIAGARQNASALLAQELRKSTEEISQAALDYVRTGQSEFLTHFIALRAHRDGAAVGQLETISPGKQPTEANTAAPFESRINQAVLNAKERNLILSAWGHALAVADVQQAAITARLGNFRDQVTGFQVKGSPDVALARRLLLGTELQERRRNIRSITAEFLNQSQGRIDRVIQRAEHRLNSIRLTMTYTFVALVAAMFSAICFVAFNILAAFTEIRHSMTAIAQEAKNQLVTGIQRNDEVGEMARAAVTMRDRSRERHARLSHLAYHDNLTNLPNREKFRQEIEHQLRRHDKEGVEVAVLMIDLDKFKEINDIYGHPAGDKVLIRTADCLVKVLDQDGVAARFGGDEFAVLFNVSESTRSIDDITNAIVTSLAEPIAVRHGVFVTSAGTIGVARTTDAPLSADQLISRADIALYAAKEEQRGTVKHFVDGMDGALRERRALQESLRDALGNNELQLVYQPQVNTRNGRISGYEALLRWTHPKHGEIPPSTFIPIAEESRQILPIGRWTIEKACAFAADWEEEARVSVNLSPTQLFDHGLVGFILSTLNRHRLPPERLEIEVTENVLIDDATRAMETLRELKLVGVKLALDDFGTGYSSLSYIMDFPFDRIKIDQSFVRALNESKEARAIVRSVVSLGTALNISVIAEGVETPQERDILTNSGCDHIQGFLTGRPQSGADTILQMGSRRQNMVRAFDDDTKAEQASTHQRKNRGSAA